MFCIPYFIIELCEGSESRLCDSLLRLVLGAARADKLLAIYLNLRREVSACRRTIPVDHFALQARLNSFRV